MLDVPPHIFALYRPALRYCTIVLLISLLFTLTGDVVDLVLDDHPRALPRVVLRYVLTRVRQRHGHAKGGVYESITIRRELGPIRKNQRGLDPTSNQGDPPPKKDIPGPQYTGGR